MILLHMRRMLLMLRMMLRRHWLMRMRIMWPLILIMLRRRRWTCFTLGFKLKQQKENENFLKTFQKDYTILPHIYLIKKKFFSLIFLFSIFSFIFLFFYSFFHFSIFFFHFSFRFKLPDSKHVSMDK